MLLSLDKLSAIAVGDSSMLFPWHAAAWQLRSRIGAVPTPDLYAVAADIVIPSVVGVISLVIAGVAVGVSRSAARTARTAEENRAANHERALRREDRQERFAAKTARSNSPKPAMRRESWWSGCTKRAVDRPPSSGGVARRGPRQVQPTRRPSASVFAGRLTAP